MRPAWTSGDSKARRVWPSTMTRMKRPRMRSRYSSRPDGVAVDCFIGYGRTRSTADPSPLDPGVPGPGQVARDSGWPQMGFRAEIGINTPSTPRLLQPVIGGFLGNNHIVDVAFAKSGRRDAHESRFVQLFEIGGAGIAHAGAQSPHQLQDDGFERPFVGHASFDALRDELVRSGMLLAVAVGCPGLHDAKRAHAAVGLESAALIEHEFAGAFIATGQQIAHHDGLRSGGPRLGDIARPFNAAIGDDGNPGVARRTAALADGSDLGHARPGYHAGGANRARTDAHLNGIDVQLDEIEGAFEGSDVSGNEI